MAQLHRQMLDVLGIRNAQKLIPMTDDQKPRDPISENMDALNMKPMKAFLYQDHDAHILAHTNFLQDPMTGKMIGQSPTAQQTTAALQAHIAEHYGFKYRQMVEQQLGAPLPYLKEEDDTLPEEYEVQISRLVAQASSQVLQQNQAQAAQEQVQQQQQDPIIQMQMQELQIKGQEVARKAAKDQQDAQLRMAQIEVEKERIQAQTDIEGHKLGMKMAHEKAVLEEKQLSEQEKMDIAGHRLGFDMASTKDRLNRETLFKLHEAKKVNTKGD
jgi:hypothetical protein